MNVAMKHYTAVSHAGARGAVSKLFATMGGPAPCWPGLAQGFARQPVRPCRME